MRLMFSLVSAALLIVSSVSVVDAKKRSEMTAAEKKELRKKGKEWCLKNHIDQTRQFERIEILSDGRIRCWFRQ